MQSMTWAPVWQAVLMNLVVPVVTALILAIGAYGVSRLPGPIQAALSSSTHKRDMDLLLGAMTRAAVARLSTGGSLTPGALTAEVVAYARDNLPDTISKLAPPPETLKTMAEAIVAEAAARLTPRAEVTGLEERGA